MGQLFTNNAASTLASAVSVGAASLTVFGGEGAKFPAPVAPDYALVTIYQKSGTTEVNHEIVKVTSRTGDVLTITRAQEGTTARSFNAGDPVELRWTAGAAHSVQIPLLDTVSGVDTITASSPFALTAQAETGSLWKLPAAGANTGAVTLNIDGMGAVSVVNSIGGALIAGDIAGANYPCFLEKRASDFVLLNPAMPHGAGTALTGTAPSLTAGNATNATNANNATTVTDGAITNVKLGNASVGVYVIHPVLSAVTHSTASKKIREVKIGRAGTYRVRFYITGQTGNITSGQIYKNGVAHGTARSFNASATNEYSEDLVFSANDLIQLYTGCNGGGSYSVKGNMIVCEGYPIQAGIDHAYLPY